MGALLEEVVRPDVIRALGPQPDARSIGQPQAGALRFPSGNIQPLASPDSLDPLVIDQPPGPAQQLGNLAVPVATVLPGQLDDVGGQPGFILTALRDLGILRCVERCWPSAAQARRFEIDSCRRTCSTQARRRAGLSSFPGPPPAGSARRGSGPTPRGATGCSRFRGPSVA